MKTILKPKSEWGRWREEAVVAQKRTKTMMSGDYVPKELVAPAVRIGADDHMAHPSRSGNTLTYRGGRTEKVEK